MFADLSFLSTGLRNGHLRTRGHPEPTGLQRDASNVVGNGLQPTGQSVVLLAQNDDPGPSVERRHVAAGGQVLAVERMCGRTLEKEQDALARLQQRR